MHNFKLKGAPGSKSGDQLYREFKQFEQDILIEDIRAAEFQKDDFNYFRTMYRVVHCYFNNVSIEPIG